MNVIIFPHRGVRVLAAYFAFLLAVAELTASENSHHGDTHHIAKHVIGLFVGKTKPQKGDTQTGIGIEYECRINQRFGVGGLYEQT